MNQGKKAMKIFVILVLSLTLTAGYAQAMPSIYNLGAHRSSSFSTISISDLLSSDSFLIFGSYFRDFSKPDISSPSKMISKDEAISIAKGLFPGIILSKPISALKIGGIWTVTIKGYYEAAPGNEYTPSGGIIKIDAKTGEIIYASHFM
jgi:hypothetical protein